MKILLWMLVALSVVVAFYALWGRAWMQRVKEEQKLAPDGSQWAVRWFIFFEPWEITLWRKSETLLKARFLMVLGAVLTFLTQMGTIDLTPFMPFVSEKYQPFVQFAINMIPISISILSAMDERLRRETTEPLAITQLSETDLKKPEVAAVVEALNVVKEEAIAVVTGEVPAPTKQADAEGN